MAAALRRQPRRSCMPPSLAGFMLLACLPALSAAAGGGDLQTVLARLYEESMPSHCHSVCTGAISLATTMQSDGSWEDINYKDKGRTEWSAAGHWKRLQTLGTALHCKGCGAAAAQESTVVQNLLPKLVAGIQFWKAHNFIDPNWWWNDFGVPMDLQGLFVIMANRTSGPNLPADLAEYGLTMLARGSDPMWEPPPRHRGSHYTGENLVWSLQLDIQRGALAGDEGLVSHAFSRMWASIVIAAQDGDGLMDDGSFHQHGALLQSGSYGAGLMTDVLNFARLSAGTKFAMPAAHLQVFVHYLITGQQYMIRAGSTVLNATWLVPPRGREISRPGAPLFESVAVAEGITTLLKLLPKDDNSSAQLLSFQKVLRGEALPISATRVFPDSDYAVHHRPGFSQDVRTWSSRTENAECVNSENMLGAHLADGAAYTYVDGTEYLNIFPVWDWRKVPGVLARQEHAVRPPCHFESLGSTDFVGGVELNSLSSGVGAVVAMDFSHGPVAKRALADAGATVANPVPDPNCTHGIRTSTFCCPTSCTECGGKKCSTPPNKGTNCCVTAIAKNGRSCDMVSAPCNIGGHVPSFNPNETLTAKRSWFLIDEGMVSLTAGATLLSADASVSVTLQQNLLQGANVVITGADGASAEPVPSGNSSFSSSSMVLHRGITYVALGTGSGTGPEPILHVYTGPQTGSWHAISGERSNSSVTAEVFKVWLDLGRAPLANGSAAYAILPGVQPAHAAVLLKRVKIISNQDFSQVVVYSRQADDNPATTTMAAIYKAGIVFSKYSELGYNLKANDSVILSFTRTSQSSTIEFAFSRPTGGSRTVRLSAPVGNIGGIRGGLKSSATSHSMSVSCKVSGDGLQQLVDLHIPEAPGRTTIGSCVAV